MKNLINCTKCKRPILDHEQDVDKGIGHCRGCDFYFLLSDKVKRKRKEIVIPNGASYIRLTIEENSLEMRIRWFRNYSMRKVFKESLINGIPGSLYYLSAYFVNKTFVKVENNILEIKHTPIDVLPYVYYKSSYVKQLYVERIGSYMKTFALYAQLSDGRKEKLLWDLDKKVLLFIEQEIERIFGIEDEHVYGEVVE